MRLKQFALRHEFSLTVECINLVVYLLLFCLQLDILPSEPPKDTKIIFSGNYSILEITLKSVNLTCISRNSQLSKIVE